MGTERTRTIEIGGRRIGTGYPTYVVAEMSANHNNDYQQAVDIIHAAKEAGADAVKLQTYTPDTLTLDADNEYFRIKGTIWEGRTLHDLYGEAYMPWDWQPKLKAVADEVGLHLFSSPFDDTAIALLQEMDIPVFKIASFENIDLGLLRKIAGTGKPIIMSTGMATLAELDEAVRTIRESGGNELAILKCTSVYPAPPEEMNLQTIPHLADAFDVPVGLSDHTLGTVVPPSAVALGACIIEKHFTLSRSTPGPDSTFSLEPQELKTMIQAIRTVEKALGTVRYGPTEHEEASLALRRSLFVVEDVARGQRFTSENIGSIRPGDGLHTRYMDDVLGKRAPRDIARGTPLSWDLVRGDG